MKTESNENWVVCRVCLNNPNDGDEILQDIFSNNANTRLDQMLHICAGIPVSIDDNYPDKMCSKCVRILRLSYKFRMTCQRSHQHITDMLASSVGDDPNNILDDYNTDTIIWDSDVNDMAKRVKIEEEDTEYTSAQVETDIVYDELVEQTSSDVVYDSNVAIVEEPVTYEVYEEMEDLSNDAHATTSGNRIVYSQSADVDDGPNDILDSDEDIYTPNRNAKSPKKFASALRKQPRKSVVIKKGKREKNSNYICDVCGNIYPTQARLTEHMKFHSGVKPHECEICGRGFVQNQQLVRHMNTHTGNRPYKCNFCPAAFADRSTKTKHHRIHTKERPYECDVCHKTFTYSDNLKFHKMIHTGEKPHVCDICGKGFVKAYKMRLHRVTHEKRGLWKPVGTEDEEFTDEIPETITS